MYVFESSQTWWIILLPDALSPVLVGEDEMDTRYGKWERDWVQLPKEYDAKYTLYEAEMVGLALGRRSYLGLGLPVRLFDMPLEPTPCKRPPNLKRRDTVKRG